jgi:enoyl-CoA hydratase
MAEDVLIRTLDCTGWITLDRPKALNALTPDMCERVSAALLRWRDDEDVNCVLIDHAGERGFCAGGDLRMMAASGAGDGREARRFFAAEYRMDELLCRYPKPVVAVMDGVTMGGGVGISRPARHRIATERTLWAMPEGDIGLFPDVGCGWWLARLPGEIGTWLALAGSRLGPADCVALGLATQVIPSDLLPALKHDLCRPGADLEAVLAGFAAAPGEAPVLALRPDIDRLFAHDSVEAILDALDQDGSDWALEQRRTISRKCPATLKVALRLLRHGARRRSFAAEMAVEYRVAVRMVHRHDFIEGVRALLIDKDNAPRWEPNTLQGMDEEALDAIFADLPPDEEWTAFA